MEIEFDFTEEKSSILGTIKRPVAEITLINNKKELMESMYVDSGADISLIPKSVGDVLGLTVEKNDERRELKGIGDYGTPIIIKKIKMKVGEKVFDSRIAWALSEEVPLILGRLDIFQVFDVCFKQNKKTVFASND